MGLELLGDVGILGADEMKDLDNLVVNGESGPGYENHGCDTRRADQDQDRQGHALDRARERLQVVEPGTMVVQAGVRHRRLEPARERRRIEAAARPAKGRNVAS